MATSMVIRTLKPSITTAWATYVCGPCSWTSDHCHRAMPRAPPEITTVPIVLTRTRSGLRTREAMPRRTTAPPIMMMGGRMASQRIGGMAIVFDAAWLAARSGAITWSPPHP